MGVGEARVSEAELCGSFVHHRDKSFDTAGDVLGDCRGGVVSRVNEGCLDQGAECHLLTRHEPDLPLPNVRGPL